jgi:SAM-dependent methyltransferase
MKRRTHALQSAADFVFAPLRLLLFPDDLSARVGLTSLEEERIRAVLPHVKGQLLDIGAGRNALVKRYGQGIGVDVFDWGGGALIVETTAKLPFSDGSFDTITFLACLNHIPYRRAVLAEARRLLKPDGRLLITMISPLIGMVGHRVFWWYSEDKTRTMAEGETYGLSTRDVLDLLHEAGFRLAAHETFVYGLNHCYVAEKAAGAPPSC